VKKRDSKSAGRRFRPARFANLNLLACVSTGPTGDCVDRLEFCYEDQELD
jgi:hypothetical protein